MYNQGAFEENQTPPLFGGIPRTVHDVTAGGLLGNRTIQYRVPHINPHRSVSDLDTRALVVSPTSKLEALKRQRFDPKTKPERVAKSLAALNQKEFIQLTPQEWRQIAEDPDIEDQF